MPKNVKMPDGSVVAFPDNMSDDQISGVLQAQHPAAKPPEQGFFSSFGDQNGIVQAVKMAGSALRHPIDTAGTVLQALNPANIGNEAADNNPILKGIAGQIDSTMSNVKQSSAAFKRGDMVEAQKRGTEAIPILGPAIVKGGDQFDAGNYAGGTGTALGALSNFITPEEAKKVTDSTSRAVRDIPDQYRGLRSKVVGGSKLDEVITGDTVTPRQRFEIAKAQGVNLDTAQATGSPVAMQTKRSIEHGIGSGTKFEDNNAANVKALHEHSQSILDTASPTAMSREDFGNTVKARLVQDQQALNEQAGSIYKDLDAKIGGTKPSTTDIRQTAQAVVDANKSYYEAHPDLLSGGAGKAWRIVNNLAESGEPVPPTVKTSAILDASGNKITSEVPGVPKHQDTWSDLHKLRSDLLDITRSPEIIGDRPTGWIKQLTGAVDRSMTGIPGTPEADAFRDANEIYKHMKQAYDNPLSKLYHIVRSPDGLTAANSLADITPDIAKQIGNAAPELVPQLQRQTMSRMLSPAGNDLPDLKNLYSRLTRAQKEKLTGVLSPEQIKSLDDLARTSRMVTFDSNPSGSGKVGQKAIEGGAIGTGLMRSGVGLVTGNPAAVAEGLTPLAYAGAQKFAASKMTNPAFTESVMNAPLKGTAKWAKQGEAKLLDHVASDSTSTLTADDITALSKTPKGKSILVRASSLTPGSAAMKNLLKSVKP